ncbi:hypothetical protein AMTRI_Chr02g216310 [Amborella trichopoda]
MSLLALKPPLILLKKARKNDSQITHGSVKQETGSPHDQHSFIFPPKKTTTNSRQFSCTVELKNTPFLETEKTLHRWYQPVS